MSAISAFTENKGKDRYRGKTGTRFRGIAGLGRRGVGKNRRKRPSSRIRITEKGGFPDMPRWRICYSEHIWEGKEEKKNVSACSFSVETTG